MIERGNLAVAETVLRAEIPRPTLADLLELTALIAQKDGGRRGRVTARWLQRWLEAAPEANIDEAASSWRHCRRSARRTMCGRSRRFET